jgi:hypothetical protein
MRLRGDRGGEIGVFEDLQTLLVVVVGITILLASVMYNWSAFGTVERDQEMYDEAERLIDAVESNDLLRAFNSYGAMYNEFKLRQSELESMANSSAFESEVKSDMNYNITFDDLEVPDSDHDPGHDVFSYYEFGKPVPEGKETVVAQVQYALVFDVHIANQDYDVSQRHACVMTVVVWR